MFKIALLACCVALSTCQSVAPTPDSSTKNPHHHEHGENGALRFHYEGRTGEMIMKTGTHCYVWMLDDTRRVDVHTKTKMEVIEYELAALASQITTETTFTPQHRDHWVHNNCNNRVTLEVKPPGQ